MNKLASIILVALLCLFLQTSYAESVTLVWDASPSTNIAGYNVYYGTSSRAYSQIVSAGNNLTCTVSNLAYGVTYYFAATAYDSWGLESDFSEEAIYTVPISYSPTITLQPTNRIVIQGSKTTFTVAATTLVGTNRYQWVFNDTNIIGATNTSLTLIKVQSTNVGNYVVVVTNGYMAVTSQVAILSIYMNPSVVQNFRLLSVSATP